MSFLITGCQLKPIFIQKETSALVLSLQLFKFFTTTFFYMFFNTLKKRVITNITDKWRESPDEWKTNADECRRVKTNEREVQTNETLMRTLFHLRDNFRCLRAFTLLNMLTDLMFKILSLFPYFDYFGPYFR